MNRGDGLAFMSRIPESRPASQGKVGHQHCNLPYCVRRIDKYQLNITYNMEETLVYDRMKAL